jgi:phosphatidylglycerol---prolipoprotein diacylglyceryl transferase
MFTLLGLTFHGYGLVVGVAVLVAVQLIEFKNNQSLKLKLAAAVPSHQVWNLVAVALVSGLVGARLWHVATDWYIYQNNLWAVFYLWQGGLSILGGVVGGAIGLAMKLRDKRLLYIFDVIMFGLPIGQSIGRFGNFINQELYGLPSNLPWAITVAPEARLAGYEQFTTFHPLFIYEALLTLIFGLGLWWWHYHRPASKFLQLGTGWIAGGYIIYYAVVRIGLDFLRIDKAMFLQTGLGVNQLMMMAVVVAVIWWWVPKIKS